MGYIEDIFTNLYRNDPNWKHGLNPDIEPGSDIEGISNDAFLSAVIPALPLLFNKYNISIILDAPCGNFSWMQHVDLTGIHYIGIDIVKDVIDYNIITYLGPDSKHYDVTFLHGDITFDWLPKADLIICRDCLVHLSHTAIQEALNNFKRSHSHYLLTTNFLECAENLDIKTGNWRRLNLELPPFNFPSPLESVSENCKIPDNLDKALSLWRIEDL